MFDSVSEYCFGGVCYKKVVVRCSTQCLSTVLEECVIRSLLSGVRLSVSVLCWRSVFASVSEYCVGGVCYKKGVVCVGGVFASVSEYCVGGVCSPQSLSTVLEECVIRRLLSGVPRSV